MPALVHAWKRYEKQGGRHEQKTQAAVDRPEAGRNCEIGKRGVGEAELKSSGETKARQDSTTFVPSKPLIGGLELNSEDGYFPS
jgi:hypothetical protein